MPSPFCRSCRFLTEPYRGLTWTFICTNYHCGAIWDPRICSHCNIAADFDDYCPNCLYYIEEYQAGPAEAGMIRGRIVQRGGRIPQGFSGHGQFYGEDKYANLHDLYDRLAQSTHRGHQSHNRANYHEYSPPRRRDGDYGYYQQGPQPRKRDDGYDYYPRHHQPRRRDSDARGNLQHNRNRSIGQSMAEPFEFREPGMDRRPPILWDVKPDSLTMETPGFYPDRFNFPISPQEASAHWQGKQDQEIRTLKDMYASMALFRASYQYTYDKQYKDRWDLLCEVRKQFIQSQFGLANPDDMNKCVYEMHRIGGRLHFIKNWMLKVALLTTKLAFDKMETGLIEAGLLQQAGQLPDFARLENARAIAATVRHFLEGRDDIRWLQIEEKVLRLIRHHIDKHVSEIPIEVQKRFRYLAESMAEYVPQKRAEPLSCGWHRLVIPDVTTHDRVLTAMNTAPPAPSGFIPLQEPQWVSILDTDDIIQLDAANSPSLQQEPQWIPVLETDFIQLDAANSPALQQEQEDPVFGTDDTAQVNEVNPPALQQAQDESMSWADDATQASATTPPVLHQGQVESLFETDYAAIANATNPPDMQQEQDSSSYTSLESFYFSSHESLSSNSSNSP